ncbi:hypothetical protein NQ318_009190 [Aromia moschata]|uniref:Uncharacterized protein n=1 Tax=Aromia moschata TaxID=1265417 RepID=A0AAV8Y3M6_9CUCU|nr:hypothetical protein NQ318_009190 [Aromia moschata]
MPRNGEIGWTTGWTKKNVVNPSHIKTSISSMHLIAAYGCGDKTRTQKQICEIFNTKYPLRLVE